MAKHTPIALTEKSAASVLDMTVTEFRKLVVKGALPGPLTFAGTIERWRMADLLAIVNGQAALPKQSDFEL